jgi:2-methylcitrate dehydratase PrpD
MAEEMEKEIGLRLAEFAVRTKFEDIPKEVIEFTKGLTLKTVAGMLVGSRKPSGQKMAGVIKNQKLSEEVGVMGSDFRTSLWEAVLLHAFYAHASELEDDRFNGGVSWDITVIPILFPLAEKLKLSGKEVMEAMIVGLEVHARTCLFNAEHLGMVLVPGAAGPAIGAAKGLGLGVKETACALGLATSGVGVSIQSFGTDAHYLESALQSLQGMIAGDMARLGMSGNPDIGTFLTTHLGKERVDPKKMVEDLGRRWFLAEIWVKKYPCCFLTHRQIDSVIELRNQHNLSLGEVASIDVHASPGDEICNRPEPKSEGDLQFSFQHVLAAALVDGDVNTENISEHAIDNPRYTEGRSRVNFMLHPDLSNIFLAEPSRVVVKMKDGREFSHERIYPIGHPKEPLTPEQFRGLYAKFTRNILPDNEISRTADAINKLETVKNVQEEMAALYSHRAS